MLNQISTTYVALATSGSKLTYVYSVQISTLSTFFHPNPLEMSLFCGTADIFSRYLPDINSFIALLKSITTSYTKGKSDKDFNNTL